MTNRLSRQAQLQQDNRKRRRKHQRLDWFTALLAGLIVVAGILAIIVPVVGLGGLSVYAGWNLGAVGISHALGGHVHSISFLTALGVGFLISALSRIFHPGAVSFTGRDA